MTDYVAYYRVSTKKQGAYGLGMDAQRTTVQSFTRPGDRIVDSYTEVESGRKVKRPELLKALESARANKATLLIAKLDRLARNMAFIANLMESKTKFTACDMPDAEPFRLHIEAAIGEEERRRISGRVKAALAEAKKRGTKLGGFRGEATMKGLRVTHAAQRDATAKHMLLVGDAVRAVSHLSLPKAAAALNARGHLSERGGKWFPQTVKRARAYLDGNRVSSGEQRI